jgi:hypothetical protein
VIALDERDEAPAAPGVVEQEAPEQELNLLIREARRRQRRRRLALSAGVTAALGLALGLAMGVGSAGTPAARSSRERPPSLGPNGRCPTSPATFVANAVFDATVLGRGTVRLAIGNVYDKARSRVLLGTTQVPGWSAIEAIWVTAPGYHGSFVVRGVRLGTPGPIDVEYPGPGSLEIPAEVDNTGFGFRVYPGSVWVRSSGCYAVQISGRGFNESIVFDGRAPVA